MKRWLATFAEEPSPAALPVAVKDLDVMSASRAVMSSVINEAEPFEAAAAASVRERVMTAYNVPA